MSYPLLVTAAVIELHGKFLLTQRKPDASHPLFWEFPGGKVEPGEDPRDCIVRELKEELNIDISVIGIYDVIYHRYSEGTVLILAYRCLWQQGELRNLHVQDHLWVKPCELNSFQLLAADIPLAERICKEFGA